ncbi:MAG: UDP-3-O-[3-hydroxymyristoyl] N-acetylglucosamine deacetylase [Epsilonproteobacteria bacterium]|nr:UDP-3-O-[3-hydroxymyristoyl] N-acetylglucosamine deacetylase [Campylobacterota bacterium]
MTDRWKQKTVSKDVIFEGIGVHTGQPSTVWVKPAIENAGITIVNVDLHDEPLVIGSVVPEVAMHATVLKSKRWMISTIEHLMAALGQLGVDNAVIEIKGYEVPILDGSSLPFVQGIQQTGLVAQNAAKKIITPKQELSIQDKHGRSICITPVQKLPSQGASLVSVDYEAEFADPSLGSPHFKAAITADCFARELAPARTFGFMHQLPLLRQHGLAQGTSLGNTVVAGKDGLLNDMRIADECVKHKVLDLLGDLALLGCQLAGTIKAKKTGHSFNRLVVEHFIRYPEQWRLLNS